MTDILDQDATDIARRIASGEVSSQEVVSASIARIRDVNPKINVIVTDNFDNAIEEAKQADAQQAVEQLRGPLHGVPITIKDTFKVAGLRCTAGAPELENYVPEADASCVQALREAGAILLAKTNTPLFAGDVHTFNDIIGRSNNPHDLGRTPGGSSGGSAAAIAAGFSALEIGSDIGGSIRIPASYCGICGHKPSHGVVPHHGHIPGPPDSIGNADLAVNGPMARSLRDLKLAFSLMARPDPAFFAGKQSWKMFEPRRQDPRKLRVGLLHEADGFELTSDVRSVFDGLEERLRHAGVEHVEPISPPMDAREMHSAYLTLLYAVFGQGFPEHVKEQLKEHAADMLDPAPPAQAAAARGLFLSHNDWLYFDQLRCQARLAWRQLFGRFDVVLSPITPYPAPRHDEAAAPLFARMVEVNGTQIPQLDALFWVGMYVHSYLPATAVPYARTAAGLPIGVQVAAGYLEDATALDFAEFLESLSDAPVPPSSLTQSMLE